MNEDRRADDHWSFDKRVPIALIFAMLFQMGAGIWYFSSLDNRVLSLEKSTDKSAVFNIELANDTQNVKDRVLRLEMMVTDIRDGIKEIKEILVKRK